MFKNTNVLKKLFSNNKTSFKFNFLKNNYFSSIRLVTRQGEVDRSENPNFNKTINWELAKVWVNPHNNSYWNSIQPAKSTDDKEQCLVSTLGKIQQIDFDRLLRRMGIIISRSASVYIQDGIVKGKKVRFVSSDKEDVAYVSSLFEDRIESVAADVHVLYLTGHPEIGTNKKFILYDKNRNIVISNAKNLEEMTRVIENIDTK